MKVKIECIGTVKDLQNRQDLQFVSDSQDVNEIKAMLGFDKYAIELNDFDSYFVKVNNGDYEEIYGLSGIIPYLYKHIFKIELTY